MTTRRDFFKGAAALAGAGLVMGTRLEKTPPLPEIDWHITPSEYAPDDYTRLVYVAAHANWKPGPQRTDWSGAMTVRDTPEAIAWAKERLASMLLRAYHGA